MKKNVLFFLPVFIPGGAGNAIYRMCKKFDKSKFGELEPLIPAEQEHEYDKGPIPVYMYTTSLSATQ